VLAGVSGLGMHMERSGGTSVSEATNCDDEEDFSWWGSHDNAIFEGACKLFKVLLF